MGLGNSGILGTSGIYCDYERIWGVGGGGGGGGGGRVEMHMLRNPRMFDTEFAHDLQVVRTMGVMIG